MLQETSESQENYLKDLLESKPEDFDAQTGFKLPDKIRDEQISSLAQVLEQGNALGQLKQTKGWKIIEDYIAGQVKYFTDKLILCKDFNEIIRIQAEILANNGLLLTMEKILMDCEHAKAKIDELSLQNDN